MVTKQINTKQKSGNCSIIAKKTKLNAEQFLRYFQTWDHWIWLQPITKQSA